MNPLEKAREQEEENPGRSCIWKYMEITRMHRSILERKFSQTGVYRSQHQLLMYIAKHPKASQKEIAGQHKISTAAVAVSLKKLEKGGYIRRAVDEKDNRYNQIHLTPKGQEIVETSQLIFGEVEKAMFEGFSKKDFDRLTKYLDRISGNLEQILWDPDIKTEREELT